MCVLFSLLVQPEDDETAYSRNMKALTDEFQNAAKRDVMNKLLKLTFQKRRESITASMARTTDLIKQYPSSVKRSGYVFNHYF